MADNNKRLVTKEVFDLLQFESVRLGKEVEMPGDFTEVGEALKSFEGDTKRLLSIINEGRKNEVAEAAEKDATGWHEFVDEDTLDEVEYSGQGADPAKKKLIDGMILNFAKAAFGFQPNFGKDPVIRESNSKARDQAREMIKNNKAMLDSIVNAK